VHLVHHHRERDDGHPVLRRALLLARLRAGRPGPYPGPRHRRGEHRPYRRPACRRGCRMTEPTDGLTVVGSNRSDLTVPAEQVHKCFGHLEVLKGIDFAVRPGEVAVVIGPSGSGKSTFLRCINHLEKINAGRIWVDGELIGYHERGNLLHEMRDTEVA